MLEMSKMVYLNIRVTKVYDKDKGECEFECDGKRYLENFEICWWEYAGGKTKDKIEVGDILKVSDFILETATRL